MSELELPRMVEVSQDTMWRVRELLAVLPENITDRYICRDVGYDKHTSAWPNMREIPQPRTVPFDINDFFVGMALRDKDDNRYSYLIVAIVPDGLLFGLNKFKDIETVNNCYVQLHRDGSTTPLTKEVAE